MKKFFHVVSVLAALSVVAAAGCGKRAKDNARSQSDERFESNSIALYEEGNEVVTEFEGASAEHVVMQALDRAGIELGYSESEGIIVAIGQAKGKVANPDSPLFQKSRMAILQKAAKYGKWRLAEIRGTNVEVSNDPASSGGGDRASGIRSSVDMDLSDIRFLTYAESWDPARFNYEVAVAVGWSTKPGKPAKQALPAAELSALVNGADALIGPRMVRDHDGFAHYLGFGVADAKLPTAKVEAEAAAKAFATFFLPSHLTAERIVETRLDEGEPSEKVSENCRETLLDSRFHSVKLLEKEVVQPISGRPVILSVVEVFQ